MKYVNQAEKFFLTACMIFTTLLLFANVILRYFFESAIFWAEEMLRYLIVWITFIGSSMCVQEQSHISIDVLSNILGKKGQRYLQIALHCLGVLFGVVFLYFSWVFIGQVRVTGQVSATIGNIPMYIIYLCFPIGFLLYAIQSADRIRCLLKEKPELEDNRS